MNDAVSAIESGKQRGFSKSIFINGNTYWCDAAIQRQGSRYMAHVSVIRKENMASEIYDLCFTQDFSALEEAIACVESNGYIQFEEFTALRGQRLFTPEFTEEA